LLVGALVIDDNLSCARHLVELLDRLGIQASLSADGAAAVEAIERSRAMDFPYDYMLPMPTWTPLPVSRWPRPGVDRVQGEVAGHADHENQRHDLSRLRGRSAFLPTWSSQ
jgi:protein-histidine pros-kinase